MTPRQRQPRSRRPRKQFTLTSTIKRPGRRRKRSKNTTDILATFAAENFLRIAEKASEGDPKVTAEIKKLRRKIAEVRNEPPPP